MFLYLTFEDSVTLAEDLRTAQHCFHIITLDMFRQEDKPVLRKWLGRRPLHNRPPKPSIYVRFPWKLIVVGTTEYIDNETLSLAMPCFPWLPDH